MLLLRDITESSPDRGVSRASLSSGHPLTRDDGTLEPVALLEMMAQGSGTLGLTENGNSPVAGLLVGMKDAEIFDTAKVGDELRITAAERMAVGQTSVVSCLVTRSEQDIASAELKVWKSEELPTNADEPAGEGEPCHLRSREALRSCRSYAQRSADPGQAVCIFDMAEDFIGFRGHFPGAPVLPAIYMLMASLATCETAIDARLTLTRVDRAKFTRQVHPKDSLRVEVSWESDSSDLIIRAGLTCADRPVASIWCTASRESLVRRNA